MSKETPTIRISDGHALADLADLEPLALAVFGAGDRPRGWFRRKLARECADPRLTAIAWSGRSPVGYFLVGRPRSLPGVAWASGLGVLPERRGRGLARALVDSVAVRCADAGLHRLELLAEPERVDFYRHLGFEVGPAGASLSARARGRRSLAPPPLPYAVDGAASAGGWLAEAWERTPERDRATHRLRVTVDGEAAEVLVHVSREGVARVIHRALVLPARGAATRSTATIERAVVAGVAGLLEQVAAPTPVIFVGVDPSTGLHEALCAGGWSSLQRYVTVARALRPASDDS